METKTEKEKYKEERSLIRQTLITWMTGLKYTSWLMIMIIITSIFWNPASYFLIIIGIILIWYSYRLTRDIKEKEKQEKEEERCLKY